MSPKSRLCEVEDCHEPHCARGYCRRHYWRYYNSRNHHPAGKGGRKSGSLQERFWRKVKKGTPLECWFWIGSLNRKGGYGLFRVDKTKVVVAHRFMWQRIEQKTIPLGYELDHTCRNKACVNPDHLQVVTRAENRRRAVIGRCSCGERMTYQHGSRVCLACDERRHELRSEAIAAAGNVRYLS